MLNRLRLRLGLFRARNYASPCLWSDDPTAVRLDWDSAHWAVAWHGWPCDGRGNPEGRFATEREAVRHIRQRVRSGSVGIPSCYAQVLHECLLAAFPRESVDVTEVKK